MNSLLTARQAAELLGISRRAFYALGLPKFKAVTRNARWKRDDLVEFKFRCRVEAMTPVERQRQATAMGISKHRIPSRDPQLSMKRIRENKQTRPYCGPAVYFLFNGDELVYVGKTVNLLHRIGSHFGRKDFDSFSFLICDEINLGRLERAAIMQYRPRLNQQ